jgi:hypothetical protein
MPRAAIADVSHEDQGMFLPMLLYGHGRKSTGLAYHARINGGNRLCNIQMGDFG